MHRAAPTLAALALSFAAAPPSGAPCTQEVEPNGSWMLATPGPGLASDPTTETFCVQGELTGDRDVDVFSTWLGFPFPVSEWGTPLHVRGSDTLLVTVYQQVPYGTGWRRIAQAAGFGEVHLGVDDVTFEHYPGQPTPYLYVQVEGRAQSYRVSNL